MSSILNQKGIPQSICALSASDTNRYSRQLVLKSFGVSRQKKLLESRVLVVGAGGLGSSVLLHLVASGVGCGGNGEIGIIDDDGDGYSKCNVDCDDTDPMAYPGAAEIESAKECMRDGDDDGWGDIKNDEKNNEGWDDNDVV